MDVLSSAEKGLSGGYPLGGFAPSALAEGARVAGLACLAGGGRVVSEAAGMVS